MQPNRETDIEVKINRALEAIKKLHQRRRDLRRELGLPRRGSSFGHSASLTGVATEIKFNNRIVRSLRSQLTHVRKQAAKRGAPPTRWLSR